MRGELGVRCLEVCLTDAPEQRHTGHRIRTVANSNPAWYRAFCAEHSAHRSKPRHRRKHDTRIKRQDTLRALDELIEGRPTSYYGEILLDFLRRYYARRRVKRIQ